MAYPFKDEHIEEAVGKTLVFVIVLAGLFIMGFIVLIIYGITAKPAHAATIRGYEVYNAINAFRAEKYLPPLHPSKELVSAAQIKANNMARQGWMSHTSPQGVMVWDSITDAGYKYSALGENLAQGFDSVTSTVEAWVRSSSHRKNILDPEFKDTGIGIAIGDYKGHKHVVFIVQLFGLRLK